MSKLISTRAIRGAHKLVERAEKELNLALESKPEDTPVKFPNTAYYLPVTYGMLGLKIDTLGGLKELLAEAKNLLPPIPAENLVGIQDGLIVLADGSRLQTLDTPGHAPHHLAIFDPVSQSLFSGEALGHYLPERRLLYPAVAPPGFDLEANRATIEKIRGLNPARICFSQFGWRDDPELVYSEILGQLDLCARLVKTGLD